MPKKNRSAKLKEELARILDIYCAVNDITMQEYINNLIENDLSDFKKKVEVIGKIS